MKTNNWNKFTFKNLWRAYRTMLHKCTKQEVLNWLGFWSPEDKKIIERLVS